MKDLKVGVPLLLEGFVTSLDHWCTDGSNFTGGMSSVTSPSQLEGTWGNLLLGC